MQNKTNPTVFELLPNVPLIKLDQQGTFKYIQIACDHIANPDKLAFVRGSNLEYHKQIFKQFQKEIKDLGYTILNQKNKEKEKDVLQQFTVKIDSHILRFRCPGGGRIVHSAQKKTLEVYGYSKTYGKVDHNIVLEYAEKVLLYDKKNLVISNKKY